MKYLAVCIIVLFSILLTAQECSEESISKFREELNAEYADEAKSPLLKEDLKTFTSLDFYPADTTFCVTAKLVRTPKEKPFSMLTSTDRKPRYKKYGVLQFTIEGKALQLDVYQSIDMMKLEQYKNTLFLPFTDLTSDNGSYGGGRYIDLLIPDGDILTIDFNKAYNPYCAYNHKYSCPLTPKQNDLAIAITAGVKEYKKK